MSLQNNNIKTNRSHIEVKDFLVSGEVFTLIRNEEHGFLETSPQPKENELGRYYDSDDYISHTDSSKGLLSFIYQMVKKYSLKKKVGLIKKQLGVVGSILDVGAGTGDFLKAAKERKWSVTGVEINEKARTVAGEKGVSLFASLDEVRGKQYDVVTLWHVLEHLPNLNQQIERLESLVAPGGILIIAVPNFNSFDAKHYKNYWAAFDVPRHLWHFSRASIRSLFASKFVVERIKPMVFDSFYVGLLSEKYKTGISFSMKGLWIGLRSNMSAFTSKEYSSLIYCLKRATEAE